MWTNGLKTRVQDTKDASRAFSLTLSIMYSCRILSQNSEIVSFSVLGATVCGGIEGLRP